MSRTRSIEKRYGRCLLCGDRVVGSDNFLTVQEGYCHSNCLNDTMVVKRPVSSVGVKN